MGPLRQAAAPNAGSPGSARHPRGLATLFFTEMWERLGYYGMRALLVLFMVDPPKNGGLGLADTTATAIYGLFTSAVYLGALPGGWIGDRLLGAQRSIITGGVLLAVGYFLLAVPGRTTFYPGLLVIVLGSGLLKPNISVCVAHLYPEGGTRRDAGFTLFYMGVNLGAALGPLLCAMAARRWGWHAGFAVAGTGMLLGLVQFQFTRRWLGANTRLAVMQTNTAVRDRRLAWIGLAILAVAAGLVGAGILRIDPVVLSRWAAVGILGLAVAYFVTVLCRGNLAPQERRRLGVIVLLFLASAVFWAGFEQAGSTLNLFAQRYTSRAVGIFGTTWEIPAGWFQSLGAIFVILFAPGLAALWLALARRRADPPPLGKFALGIGLLAAGFGVMALASSFVAHGRSVLPVWLVATYLLHALGELCLSPVGLSSVTKLAPPRLAGQMLGIWFLATSLGNLLAGVLAGNFRSDAVAAMPVTFLVFAVVGIGAAILLALLARPVQRLVGGPE